MSDRLKIPVALLAVTALLAASGCGGYDSGKAKSKPAATKTSKPNGY